MERTYRRSRSGIAFTVIASIGCATAHQVPKPVSVPSTPAQIAAIPVQEFSGNGEAILGHERRALARLDFVVLSRGTGSSVGRLVMLHGGTGVPRVGRYAIVALRRTPADSSAFEAILTVRGAQAAKVNFVAQSGEVEISESGAKRVAGTFRMLVRPYCGSSVGQGAAACSPLRADVESPPLIVRGSFAVSAPAGAPQRASAPEKKRSTRRKPRQ